VVQRIRRYIEESIAELRKVTWPTREQVRNLTVLVFVVSAAVGVYIAFFDQMWTAVLRFITTGQFLPS
jgi:preprotein translocase subunit SecE